MSTNGKTDFYELLEVGRQATVEEIRRAYRRIAAKVHPDRNPGDQAAEDRFKAVSEAYQVLSDANKRARYDRFGHASTASGGDGFGAPDLGAVTEMLDTLMREVFGGQRARRSIGRDIEYHLDVSFEEAALGAEKGINYPRAAAPDNNGSAVNGHADEQRMSVRVPPGVQDGAVRTVRGAGEIGPDGPGDLHVYIKIRPHEQFERDGADVLSRVSVSFPQAVLGGQLEVATLDGAVKMRLPPGTESGKVFRLRGKGIPVFGGYGRGDQLVSVVVEVPNEITREQRRLIEALGAEMDGKATAEQRNLLGRLRDLLG